MFCKLHPVLDRFGFTFHNTVKLKKYLPAGVYTIILMFRAGFIPVNHFLIYPETVPPGIKAWREEIRKGKLLLRLEWARPEGTGPFTAVLVHPAAGKKSSHMCGVIRSLAEAGYLAAAVDYKRLADGTYQDTLFPWREETDALAAYELLKAHPDADPKRIGLLGFSQGGVFSILIASLIGKSAKAAAAFYPITDFVHWLDASKCNNGIQRRIRQRIREYFYRQSKASSVGEFESMLRRASPMYQIQTLRSPLFLVHGKDDTTAPVEYSQMLYARMRELGRKCELLVIPDAPHVFNFRVRKQAETAWTATLGWLDRILK